MLGTFPGGNFPWVFSQVATSNCVISHNLWEVAVWEFAHLGSSLENCHLRKYRTLFKWV